MAKQTLNTILRENVMCSQVSRKRDGSGNFLFRKSYFYTNGQTSEGFADSIAKQLDKLGLEHAIVDNGDHWAAFKGGASVAKQSHFWVEVSIDA